MTEVSVRDLRNHGGDVLDNVQRGQTVIVTRSGKPVAELRPLGPKGTPAAELLRRWKHVPHIDLAILRADLDEILDPTL
jgi:prevent-host-death family protein